VEVPPGWFAQGKKRIEINICSSAYVLGRRARERKIEEDQVELMATSDHSDGDVVGLNISMGDTLFFEIPDYVEKILAESL
jgi:hypothetical protein